METSIVAKAADHPHLPGEATLFLGRGSASVMYYAPRRTDTQQPHEQDELYIVDRGSGWFVTPDGRVQVGPGDAIFIAARAVHRFEDFSDDFGTWVVFYGPKGGEQ